ncbi:MAG: hypothetical protein AUJ52_02115 [Elusimicrobia bacterium CG1_02_63_36]|nr:MAG: hypothetical protein AUJ52_02115 [Elusimicrobia bacterium CG1_02_63_36]PIP83639.1 MAG: hypothetical protein COR54_08565 [Elusimicrobia bacterium CG22_combo_CG10-13_8_21_14_all_63_91]PJA14437.1 MAG: hypothetical protein COX66_12450 [Elusimicrobia bacterium CG_4_10_14_0_2_um_filter_63_34]PJB27097.1 MAG: hypothetical protein CO113_00255 [Elusimicrobia bacterium CG_4_9_14_3_um_filter_62_55]
MFFSALHAVGVADLLDIALVAVLIYALLVWFKQSKAAVVAKGMLVVAAIYLFSRSAGMIMMTALFHAFFAILIVALVVIFQEELRAIFERIAVWSLSGGQVEMATGSDKQADVLTRTLGDLARERIGALVVLRGRDPLERHLQGGFSLGGDLSEALLKSIFDFHSIGHDGAVILEGGRVTRFGCRLPLSKEGAKTARFGTRHTAALGLAELSDALCIVVSEERGTISIAQDGKIETLRGAAQLEKRLSVFYSEKQPRPRQDQVREFLKLNQREKGMAAIAAVLLWGLFVLGAKPYRQAYSVPVRVRNLPPGMRVASLSPDKIRLVVSGQMRDFYWIDTRRFEVRIDLSDSRRGSSYMRLTENDVVRPKQVLLEEIDPSGVQVELADKSVRVLESAR